MKTAIPADFDPMLELARARLAAYPNHGPWEGTNHADCPICHAREQIYAAGLGEPRRIAPGNSLSVRLDGRGAAMKYPKTPGPIPAPIPIIDEDEDEYLPGMAQRILAEMKFK